MTYTLHNLKRPKSNKRSSKRLGRGNASGKGTYSAKGMKGQTARSGGRARLKRRSLFQQLLIRTPKLRGFKHKSKEVVIINLGELNKIFKEGDIVSPAVLIKKGIVQKTPGGVKILSNGAINKKLKISAHAFSSSAKAAIEKSGGTWEIIK